MAKKDKKVGVAFSTGGVKGLAHVGVLKVLLKHNIPIDMVSGSSIGAWVAAHWALMGDIDLLEQHTVYSKREKFSTFLEPSFNGGIIKGTRLKKLLHHWLNNSSFKDTHIPLGIHTTDLISGKPVIFKKGEIIPPLLGSMAVPTLFAPVQYKNYLLCDGGLTDPVPDDIVRKMGADIVISVNLDTTKKTNSFSENDLSLTKVATRSLDIMRYYLAESSLNTTDVLIEPVIPNIEFNSWRRYFTENIGEHIMKMGERAAEKKIPEIKKILKQ